MSGAADETDAGRTPEEERGREGKDENSYRSILKGTSVFGGVQVFQILLNLVRGKFVALLLGPAGMGVNSLLNTAGLTMVRASSLGLNLAIVKEISACKEDNSRLHIAVALARRMVAVTALIGAVACFLLSGALSRMTFGDASHSGWFMLLSLMVFFTVAGNGMMSVLQGLHRVRVLSGASIVGGIAGLTVGVPLYYFYGVDGIVPAMIAFSLSTFLFFRISANKAVGKSEIGFRWKEHRPLIKKLLALGLILMAGDLISTLVNYLLNIYIRWHGALDDVGLFQGANSLTNQYAGMIFTAMMLDYFPRLAAASSDNMKIGIIVRRQLEIVSFIATPLIALLILTAPLVIRVLLSSEFLPITPLIRWLGIGVLLRAFMYPLGYITFAKDNKKLFFWMEAVGLNAMTLLLNCAGYSLFGLNGLGYALIVDCCICFLLYCIVNRRLYGLRIDIRTLRALGLGLMTAGAVIMGSLLTEHSPVAGYTISAAICAVSIIYSFNRLKKLIKK